MNDATAVRGSEGLGNLQTDQQSGFQLEWTARDELSHVLAFDKLHRNEVNTVDFIEIEDRADVWVVQRRGNARFAFETFEIRLFRAELRGDDFNHNRAAKLSVGGFVDRALPANTELVGNAIIAKRLTYHWLISHG